MSNRDLGLIAASAALLLAALCLARIAHACEARTEELIAKLKDRGAASAKERAHLVRELGSLTSIQEVCGLRVIPFLLDITKDEDDEPSVRIEAMHALAELHRGLLSKVLPAKTQEEAVLVNALSALAGPGNPNMAVRTQALLVLARLRKLGLEGINLIPNLKKILAQQENTDLVMVAVEALSILDEEGSVALLVQAYGDFLDTDDLDDEADVRIRVAIVGAMADLLQAQVVRKNPVPETIKRIAETLLRIVDPRAEPKEAAKVVESAIFALRYLYPGRPDFQPYHRLAAEVLILRWRQSRNSTELTEAIVDSLGVLTPSCWEDPGNSLPGWEKWYAKRYPAFRLPKQ